MDGISSKFEKKELFSIPESLFPLLESSARQSEMLRLPTKRMCDVQVRDICWNPRNNSWFLEHAMTYSPTRGYDTCSHFWLSHLRGCANDSFA